MAADQCSVVVASVVSLDPAKERRGQPIIRHKTETNGTH